MGQCLRCGLGGNLFLLFGTFGHHFVWITAMPSGIFIVLPCWLHSSTGPFFQFLKFEVNLIPQNVLCHQTICSESNQVPGQSWKSGSFMDPSTSVQAKNSDEQHRTLPVHQQGEGSSGTYGTRDSTVGGSSPRSSCCSQLWCSRESASVGRREKSPAPM